MVPVLLGADTRFALEGEDSVLTDRITNLHSKIAIAIVEAAQRKT
jgi:hypothetical protein